VRYFDRGGATAGAATELAYRDGDRVCARLPPAGAGYLIASFALAGRPPVEVHLARTADSAWRILGLWRH
jgi:hypothetical protein